MHPEKSSESKNERDIRRIMVIGTAIGVGCMAASLEALRASASGFSFHISARTFIVFAIAATLMVPFWKIAFRLVSGNGIRARHVWGALLLLLIGLGAFLYPLRFVPTEVRPQLLTGFILAVFALTVLALLLFRIARFFEAEAKEKERSK